VIDKMSLVLPAAVSYAIVTFSPVAADADQVAISVTRYDVSPPPVGQLDLVAIRINHTQQLGIDPTDHLVGLFDLGVTIGPRPKTTSQAQGVKAARAVLAHIRSARCIPAVHNLSAILTHTSDRTARRVHRAHQARDAPAQAQAPVVTIVVSATTQAVVRATNPNIRPHPNQPLVLLLNHQVARAGIDQHLLTTAALCTNTQLPRTAQHTTRRVEQTQTLTSNDGNHLNSPYRRCTAAPALF